MVPNQLDHKTMVLNLMYPHITTIELLQQAIRSQLLQEIAQAIFMAKDGQAMFWLSKWFPIRGENFCLKARTWLWLVA